MGGERRRIIVGSDADSAAVAAHTLPGAIVGGRRPRPRVEGGGGEGEASGCGTAAAAACCRAAGGGVAPPGVADGGGGGAGVAREVLSLAVRDREQRAMNRRRP